MRPGMGRGFEHGPPPGDMGRGAPWMGKKSVYLNVFYSFVVPFIKNKRFCYHLKNKNLGVLSITAEH